MADTFVTPGSLPAYPSTRDCPRCGRHDFPLLLVRPTVVDDRHGLLLQDAGYGYAFDDDFKSMPREGTLPLARLLSSGFVYVYYASAQRWDVWQSFPDGSYTRLLEQVTADEYAHKSGGLKPESFESVCSRGAANVPAGLITLRRPETQSAVWIAHAPHLWHADVLRDYGTDAHGKRDKRMTHFDARAWIEGDGDRPANAHPLFAGILEAAVAEFAESAFPARMVFARAMAPLTEGRFGQAQAMADAARALERTAGKAAEGKALIFMLHDPVGVAEEYNTLRLAIQQEQQAWLAGGVDARGRNADPDRPWKRQSMMVAGYVREWVRKQQQDRIERVYDIHQPGDGMLISEREYLSIRDDEDGAGGPAYPEGTRFEPIDQPFRDKYTPEIYRVVFPSGREAEGQRMLAERRAQPKIDRYNEHLDWDAIERTNAEWKAQARGWDELLAKRDRDYLAWLESETLQVALQYDYADRQALAAAARDADQLRADVANAAARLDAVGRCLGGGICGEDSLQYFVKLYAKDEGDPTHWPARALIKDFDLLARVQSDPGLQADLYDAFLGAQGAFESFKQAWQGYRDNGVTQAATLLLVSSQTTAHMQRLAVDADEAKRLGIHSQVQFAQRKQGVWVRASALHDFIDSGRRQYLIGVLMDGTHGLNAMAGSGQLAPAYRLRTSDTERVRRHVNRRSRSTRSTLQTARVGRTPDFTVYLALDAEKLRNLPARHRGPMLPVTSHDLFGKPQVVELPESLIDDLIREPTRQLADVHRQGIKNLGAHKAPGLLGVTVMLLQGRALSQVDAAASMVSSVLGFSGAAAEIGAIYMARPALTAAGTVPAATAGTALSWAVRLRLGAGFMGGAGALFDGISAAAKFASADAQGDSDAARLFAWQAGFQIVGAFSLSASSLVALRVAQHAALQTGTRLVLGIGGAAVVGTTLAAWLTGIGFVLWLIGFGFSLWALHNENDAQEDWLDRSYFGLGENKELGKFDSLDDEMQAFGALSLGIAVEVGWNDELFGADLIEAEFKLPAWQAGDRIRYKLQCYTNVNARPIGAPLTGEITHAPLDGGLHVARLSTPVTNSRVGAVRLDWSLYQDGGTNPVAGDEVWAAD